MKSRTILQKFWWTPHWDIQLHVYSHLNSPLPAGLHALKNLTRSSTDEMWKYLKNVLKFFTHVQHNSVKIPLMKLKQNYSQKMTT